MIYIDGSRGEGGGQIIRSALALSLVTGKAFQIKNIRAGRKRPGLLRQHLTAVNAAAEIGCARLEGAYLKSNELTFVPGKPQAGSYKFSIATAGSANLVLQTVLPVLLGLSEPSELVLEGGTHNQMSPPFDFLANTFVPLMERMGPRISMELERHGFYPAGGGRMKVQVRPAPLQPLTLLECGALKRKSARALISKLPIHIAKRELETVAELMGLGEDCLSIHEVTQSPGPGNVLFVEAEFEQVTATFCAFAERGTKAERVAKEAVLEARAFLVANVPVGMYLADQLLLPMALAGGGSFRTLEPTSHFHTNVEVIGLFLDVPIVTEQDSELAWRVTVN